ncbi:unnamed protein product [Cyprideis torosa]|uniref:Uncharacterized protein n=1 Tax=Cyprideis torosa TaxID=163714 RepID=A0A7R8ZGU1_9CRUS|nr:unnamed protein product [Cyprideis torosa]CAG0881029.1 unnamed protein product [Cyprideis torosa]
MFSIKPGRPFETFSELSKTYGEIVSVSVPQGLYQIVFHNPDDILDICNRPEAIPRPFSSTLLEIGADGKENVGLITSHGRIWQDNRRFTMRTLRDFGFGKSDLDHLILGDVKAMIEIMEKKQGQPVDLDFHLNVAIVNTLWRMVGNQSFDYDDPKLLQFFHCLEETLDVLAIAGVVNLRRGLMPFTIGGWRLKKALVKMQKEFRGFEQLILHHKQSRDSDFNRDYVDAYLAEIEGSSHNPKIMNEEQLLYNIRHLFIAGSETTSTTIRWALLFLVEHPEIQSKVHEEIDQVIGRDRYVSLDDRGKLNYTEAMIMEVLRLSNVAPLGVVHSCFTDFKFKGFLIPAGSFILPNQYSIHMNPKYWPNPRKFDPTRFLDENGKTKTSRIPGFLPFGLGKRQCLGEALAKMELFLFLTNFLQRFRFRPAPNEKLPSIDDSILAGAVLRPLHYKLIVEVRE